MRIGNDAESRTLVATKGLANFKPALPDPTEFQQLQTLVHQSCGVVITDDKRALIAARLNQRLRHHRLDTYRDYLQLLEQPHYQAERSLAIDLLVAKETYFFREHRHFEYLGQWLANHQGPVRLWSAACSSGEEAYSLAMVASEHAATDHWEVLASDVSTRMLSLAQAGIYDIAQARYFPEGWLERHGLCGIGQMVGRLRMSACLRQRLTLKTINLIHPLPDDLGHFHAIFLRNLLMYVDSEHKPSLLKDIVARLHPGGLLFIGHAESIHELALPLRPILPSVFERL